ncbi:peptidyl-prolyl cis-trans isomerase [bacterium]|nr:peptidyl-prolyl cis-trans isomerase [bacterium]
MIRSVSEKVHGVMMQTLTSRRRAYQLLLAVLLLMPTSNILGQFGGGGPSSGMNGGAQMPNKAKKKYKKPEVSRVNAGLTSFHIAAVVDDQTILLEDVMTQIRPKLEAQKRQLPPAQYKQLEEQAIQMAVKGKIQQTVLINELKKKIPKAEAMEKIRAAAAVDFEKHMQQVARQSNLKSKDELIAQLKKEGADLTTMKNSYIDHTLAQQFLGSQIMPKLREPTRDEMEDFYQENIDKWSQKAGVVWRNIEIKKGADPAAARAKIGDLREQLEKGSDFATIAKSSSEGTMAAAGGLWSRTSKGSYQDEAVDSALFTLPVGEISPVIEGKGSFHIIRVEERNDGSPLPFIKVQEEIKNALRNKQIEKHKKELLEEIMANHHVISIFDSENPLNHQIPAQPNSPGGPETNQMARPDMPSSNLR